jgi:hypothetical protein
LDLSNNPPQFQKPQHRASEVGAFGFFGEVSSGCSQQKKRQKPLELKAAVSKPGNFPKTALDVHLRNRLFADGSNTCH